MPLAAETTVRRLTVWCPDWPIVAWGLPLDEPVAVLSANRVVACSPVARAVGVAAGQRRRDAQRRCPEIALVERDLEREVRRFESVLMALEDLTPGLEVIRPGLAAFAIRGPARFFGGESAVGERVLDTVAAVLDGDRDLVRIGIADGRFASIMAARAGLSVPPGESAAFLDPQPLGSLSWMRNDEEQRQLIGVLQQLGIRTLGQLVKLSVPDVIGRFGRLGQEARQLALGADLRPPTVAKPIQDLAVNWTFDPPAISTDPCAFAAKALGDQLFQRLAAEGLSCVQISIEAEMVDHEVVRRVWRHDGALSAAAMADRARWQLDAWRTRRMMRTPTRRSADGSEPSAEVMGRAADGADHSADEAAETGGVIRLTLLPEHVIPATGQQMGLWDRVDTGTEGVQRVVARLQAILGPEAIMVPERRGGRGPTEQLRLIPAATVDLRAERAAVHDAWVDEPWPGRLPSPSPARVLHDPVELIVVDHQDRQVVVNGRGEIETAPYWMQERVPQYLSRDASTRAARSTLRRQVVAWAGPWPVDEQWWNPSQYRRRARFQFVLDDGSAHIVAVERGTFWLEASYE